jgi:hypothetical protein
MGYLGEKLGFTRPGFAMVRNVLAESRLTGLADALALPPLSMGIENGFTYSEMGSNKGE